MIKKVISIAGDSQSALFGVSQYGIPSFNAWGPVLARRLSTSDLLVSARVFGRSGDATAQILGRSYELNRYGVPDIGIVYAGVNDPGSAITGTAAAGSSTSITLDANASALLFSYVGNVITITSGQGSGQSKTIIDYSTSKIATVDSSWSTVPNNTSVYSIAAPTQTQMQANHQALIKIFKYGIRSYDPLLTTGIIPPLAVWSQSQLPGNGSIGSRFVVLRDTSTTGGLKSNSVKMNPTISGDYSATPKQSVWEFRAAMAGESGWGRVAIDSTPAFSDGCSKVISMGSNYLNFPTGGDNYNADTETGTQAPGYVPVRAAAKAAAIAEGTEYCDLYAFQSMLIYGGTFLGNTINIETFQGSGTFHYIPTNQHHSTYGNDTVARAVEFKIRNENWV